MSQCSLSFISDRFRLGRVNSTTFVSFSNESVSGIVTWKDKHSKFLFSGFQLETLIPGCVLLVRGVILVSSFDPKIDEKQVVLVFKRNVSFAANMRALNSSLTQALSDFYEIDLNTLVKGGENCRIRFLWKQLRAERTWIAWMVLGIIMSVTAGMTGALYLCRQRFYAASDWCPPGG